MIALLTALGPIISLLGGGIAFVSLVLKIRDRHDQRRAIMRARDEATRKALNESLPPLTGWLAFAITASLLAAVWPHAGPTIMAAAKGAKTCTAQTCPLPARCVGNDCQGAADTSKPRPRPKPKPQRAGLADPALPSSWGFEVRPAWADPAPIDPFLPPSPQ